MRWGAFAVVNLRKPVLIAVGVGVVGLLVCGLVGHIMLGVFGVVGMGLGVLNTWLMQKSVARLIVRENPGKNAIGKSAVPRLVLIAALAFAMCVLVRPAGLGVVFGLVIFQVIIIGTIGTSAMTENRERAVS
jgi:hypothetical protein